MTKRQPWSNSEIRVLKDGYPDVGADGVAPQLPLRSLKAITRMARALKLRSPSDKKWDDKEDALLIRYYRSHGAAYVAEKTQRSIYGVMHRAGHLRHKLLAPESHPPAQSPKRTSKKVTHRSTPLHYARNGALGGRPAKYTLEQLQKHASKRGGQLLSPRYEGYRKGKHHWQCKFGHEWKATWEMVHKGSWCPTCRESKSMCALSDLSRFAQEQGGRCLSTTPVPPTRLAQWECAKHHQFASTFRAVQERKHHWCPVCAKILAARIERRKKKADSQANLRELQTVAASHQGRCVSTKFHGRSARHTFECKRGHRWKDKAQAVLSGAWCRQCSKKSTSMIRLHTQAANHGGLCLSKRFRGNDHNYAWQCAKGHRWRANWYSVRSGSWCRECYNDRRRTTPIAIEVLQAHAAKKKGRLLSSDVGHSTEKYHWQCSQGHQWWATWSSVNNQGTWCRKCHQEKRRLPYTITDLATAAAERNGRCLSLEYINTSTKYTWECSKGHTWTAAWSSISRGSWCPSCAKERANQLAKERRTTRKQ